MKSPKNGTPKPEPVPTPKVTQVTTEYLTVPFTTDELLALGAQLARALQADTDLEERMKSQKLEWNEEQDGIDKSIRNLKHKLNARGEMRDTLCKWIYEEPTKAEKSLVRLDTGEIARVVPMQSYDYQDGLPIGTTESPGEPLELTPPPANGHSSGKEAGQP